MFQGLNSNCYSEYLYHPIPFSGSKRQEMIDYNLLMATLYPSLNFFLALELDKDDQNTDIE